MSMALLNIKEISIKLIFTIWVLLLLIIPLTAQAKVRTVYVNDKKMEKIFLNMGKSTILRFREKPKKVVIGNQNYFQVEFIDSDITIQPQGIATTNMFAYCENNTYGFILNVSNSGKYDDLINVRWRPKTSFHFSQKRKPQKRIVTNKKISKDLKLEGIKIKIDKISYDEKRNFHIIDTFIENLDIKAFIIKNLRIALTRKKKDLEKKFIVFEKEVLKTKEKAKIRVFVRLKIKKGFTLKFSLNDKNVSTIISRRKL